MECSRSLEVQVDERRHPGSSLPAFANGRGTEALGNYMLMTPGNQKQSNICKKEVVSHLTVCPSNSNRRKRASSLFMTSRSGRHKASTLGTTILIQSWRSAIIPRTYGNNNMQRITSGMLARNVKRRLCVKISTKSVLSTVATNNSNWAKASLLMVSKEARGMQESARRRK